jgi:DNA polymerase elongation subunit (family B)
METKSIEELKKRIEELTERKNELKNEEQAVKLTMNSIYGSLANAYFVCFNTDVAEAVTLQGQDLIKFSEKIINKYFNEHWHLDKELHEKIGLKEVRRVSAPVIIYADTDSSEGSSEVIIKTNTDIKKIEFQNLFKMYSDIFDISVDDRGNEIIEPKGISSLNYKEEELVFSGIKKIIRHKVSKPKWKILSESGKEVIVTNDHSIKIFRNGKKIHIKPSEINLETDMILSVDIDI